LALKKKRMQNILLEILLVVTQPYLVNFFTNKLPKNFSYNLTQSRVLRNGKMMDNHPMNPFVNSVCTDFNSC